MIRQDHRCQIFACRLDQHTVNSLCGRLLGSASSNETNSFLDPLIGYQCRKLVAGPISAFDR